MQHPLRLLLYDETCRGRGFAPGLTHSWIAGGVLYRALGRLDAARGVKSWDEALDWLATFEGDRPIGEIQYWGHGKWGELFVARDVLDERDLMKRSARYARLDQIRKRLAGEDSLVWFRTCETFGAERGLSFASAVADFFGCRAAGHTFIIGPWQSGLHSLRPGEEPRWSAEEGIAEGSAAAPRKALWSGPSRPNTIHCLQGKIPPGC